MIKHFSAFFTLLLFFLHLNASATEKPRYHTPGTLAAGPAAFADDAHQQQWVDSVFNQMDEAQQIGQLIMAMAYSNLGPSHEASVAKLVTDNHIGGLIFMQGGPARQARLTNKYQRLAQVPLFIAMDAENGLSMRLDSTISFPKNITLGAIQNNEYIYELGREIGRQSRRLGVHINFAPVIDVNVNPANPVIGIRSFGENKYNVAGKGSAFMRGLQNTGVIANAKHFPGHGDTDKDSHHTLPVINHSRERLNEVELYPFRQLFADSLMSVMVAHLQIPALDDTPDRASSLSPKVVTELLRDSLGFNGLVFTDGLNMQGVARYYSQAQICVQALKAGNDILLGPGDIPSCISAIKAALGSGDLNRKSFEQKVKRVLSYKYLAGLHHYVPVQEAGVAADLNNKNSIALKSVLYEQAVTFAKNPDRFLPVVKVDSVEFASLSIGQAKGNIFQQNLSRYARFTHFALENARASQYQYDQMYASLKNKDVVMVALHDMSNRASSQFGVRPELTRFLARLSEVTRVVAVGFGNPYGLKYLQTADYVVAAYENDPLMQKAVPQVLFGAINSYATLPVTASEQLPEGSGQRVISLGRLGFALPEQVGMSSAGLQRIDSLVYKSLADEAAPGCQVLVARNGRVVFQKNYGYHTYSKKQPVTDESVYDLASLTKVLSTLQGVMLLEEQGKIDLDKPVAAYLPELQGTNKSGIVLRDVLLHQAGLQSFYPFWNRIMNKRAYNPLYLSNTRNARFSVPVTPELFAVEGIADSVWQWTLETDLNRRARYGYYNYRYSDLGFIMMKELIERVSGQRLDDFVNQHFYKPMGLQYMGYNPLYHFDKQQIVPTEMDIYLRRTLVHGYVHDPGAALQEGVGGHAGIFSNAWDVAVMLQMNLQEGFYGGKWLLNPETIHKFNSRYSTRNRRGLGWDKPDIKRLANNSSDFTSESTFGHTGFTGTCAWADPEQQLVYVFLSNRVHPFVGNQKLVRENVRTRIQDIIYESIKGFDEKLALNKAATP